MKSSPEHWYSGSQLLQTSKLLFFYLLFWLIVGAAALTAAYFIDGGFKEMGHDQAADPY